MRKLPIQTRVSSGSCLALKNIEFFIKKKSMERRVVLYCLRRRAIFSSLILISYSKTSLYKYCSLQYKIMLSTNKCKCTHCLYMHIYICRTQSIQELYCQELHALIRQEPLEAERFVARPCAGLHRCCAASDASLHWMPTMFTTPLSSDPKKKVAS